MKQASRGYGVLEFLVVVVLIGGLMLAFLDRIDFYRESIEKTAMEQLSREMGWALRIRAAELMLANRNDDIGRLEGANPVEALQMRIANYAGAGLSAEEPGVPSGQWFFNRDSRELVYFPALTSNFANTSGGRARVAWRVAVVNQANSPAGKPKPQWVRLELVQPYHWLEDKK
jgi:hypothetical protein